VFAKKENEMSESSEAMELLYPIYLNVPMMISFVATMDGGYSLEKVWKETKNLSGEVAGELEGEAGLPAMVSWLAHASLKASGSVDGKLGKSEESQIVFKHTEASIFIRLRHELRRQGRVISLDACDEEHWQQIPPFSFVEISGQIHRTPINEIVQLSKRLIPIMVQSLPLNKDGNIDISALSQEQINLLATVSIVQAVVADLESSPLSDVIIKHEGQWEKVAVLNLSTNMLPLSDQELLHCGNVRVIGKVTRVLTKKDSINLYRRSVLGIAAQSLSTQWVESFKSMPDVNIKLESPTVEYPAVEILPMAVYV
jgi:hypothetical protein